MDARKGLSSVSFQAIRKNMLKRCSTHWLSRIETQIATRSLSAFRHKGDSTSAGWHSTSLATWVMTANGTTGDWKVHRSSGIIGGPRMSMCGSTLPMIHQ